EKRPDLPHARLRRRQRWRSHLARPALHHFTGRMRTPGERLGASRLAGVRQSIPVNSPLLQKLLAVLLATSATSLVACSGPHKPPLAIPHVTVIDAIGGPPRADMTVVIEGDRLALVEPSSSASPPPGTPIVDGSGKFLVPGLADMHVHLTGAGEPDGSRR